MLAFARRRPVLSHFLLSFLIASLVIVFAVAAFIVNPASAGATTTLVNNITASDGYINLLTIASETVKQPMLMTIFVFAFAPTISALLLAAAGVGGGWSRLISRFNPVGPEGTRGRAVRLYLVLLAVYAFGLFVYDWISGPGVNALERLEGFGAGIVFGALIGLFVDEGGTLEELGWRGFAWPILLDSMRSPLVAAVVLGALHWGWHLPREVFTIMGGAPLSTFLVNQTVFLVLCIALSIVAGYCVNQAGGSVWPAIFVHGGSNVWSKAASDSVTPTFGFLDPRTMMLVVLAAVIAAFAHRHLGRATVAAGPSAG